MTDVALNQYRAQVDLNDRYTYARDQGEHWQILRGSGPVSGDCEDYSLTLIWLAEGRAMWAFWWFQIVCRHVLFHCTSPGGRGHVVLWTRGVGWTDNIQRRPVTRADLRRMGYRIWFPWLAPLVALKFLTRRLIGRRKT